MGVECNKLLIRYLWWSFVKMTEVNCRNDIEMWLLMGNSLLLLWCDDNLKLHLLIELLLLICMLISGVMENCDD